MEIHIDKRLCKGCKLCLSNCPKDVFGMSSDVNQKGYNYAVAEHADACIGCKKCEKYCPDFAIYIVKE